MIDDLRLGTRRLWRRRRGSLLTLLVLALGIGLATAMFSVLDGVLLRGLPFPDGDRIVLFSTQQGHDAPLPAQDFLDLRTRQRVLEEVGAFRTYNTVVTQPGVGSKGLTATYVSGNLFDLLGAEPLIGRSFQVADEDPATASVAMLSHRVWTTQFGADPGIIGKTIVLNREVMSIIGVMPAGFHFPIRQDAWAILRWQGRPWSGAPAFAVGKLRPGMSAARAERELAPLIAELDALRPLDTPRQSHVQGYVETLLPSAVQRSLRVMLVAVFGVLLIACFNAGNLRLGDTLARQRELTVRQALGAGRGRLIRLLLAEAAVLTIASTATGLFLAWCWVRLAAGTLLQGSPLVQQFWITIRIDLRACAFAMAVGAVAMVLGGLVPALWSLRRRSLRSTGRATASRRESRLAMSLVAIEVGVCFALVLGAGLLVRSGLSLLASRPGFESQHLMRTIVTSFQADDQSTTARRAFWERLLPALEARAEIAGATLASGPPWREQRSMGVQLTSSDPDTVEALPRGQLPRAQLSRVLPGYFATLRLPLLAGRGFEPADVLAQEATPPPQLLPAVVSASFARHHLGPSPLGRSFALLPARDDAPPLHLTVVGLAADTGLGRRDRPDAEDAVYLPFSFAQASSGFLLVHGRAGTAGLQDLVEQEVAALDPQVATLDDMTYDEERARQTWTERRLAQLFLFFACTALLLTGAGLYGVIALSLRRRRAELAIRAALGAVPRDLTALLLREGGRYVLFGLALGLVLNSYLGTFLRQLLYEVEPWDPAVTAIGVATIAAVALSAILGPARRAARTDPARELQAD